MSSTQTYLTPDEVKKQGKKFIAEQADILREELRSQKIQRDVEYV